MSVGSVKTLALECIATLNKASAERGVSSEDLRQPLIFNLRHQSSGKSLEEQSHTGSDARKVRAKTGAHGEETSEQSDDGEEEGDEVKGKHEPREVIVFVSADESGRKTIGGTEVTRGVEWQSRHRWSAIAVEAIHSTANLKESPSRRVARSGCARGCSLEEIGEVERSDVYDAGQNDEE